MEQSEYQTHRAAVMTHEEIVRERIRRAVEVEIEIIHCLQEIDAALDMRDRDAFRALTLHLKTLTAMSRHQIVPMQHA